MTDRKTSFSVDDNPENLAVLRGLLTPEFQVLAGATGDRALQIAHVEPRPDLTHLVSIPAVLA